MSLGAWRKEWSSDIFPEFPRICFSFVAACWCTGDFWAILFFLFNWISFFFFSCSCFFLFFSYFWCPLFLVQRFLLVLLVATDQRLFKSLCAENFNKVPAMLTIFWHLIALFICEVIHTCSQNLYLF